ncbi:MAG: WYL domain-containing protein [Candidatus Kapabacteria bacterium]|nr:WYL domain-containing protein [Candidatus Kapabacteria bacterium]
MTLLAPCRYLTLCDYSLAHVRIFEHCRRWPMSNQVRRVAKILSKLSSGFRYTTDELLEHMRRSDDTLVVSRRQIERDLKAISEGGVPLMTERRDRTVYYYLARGTGIATMTGTVQNDAFLLYMLKASLPLLRDSSLQEMVDELRQEIDSVAPGDVLLPDAILASVSLGHYAGQVDQKILADILAYIAQKQWIRALYGDAGKTQLLFPFKIIPYLGRLYLAVWHGKHDRYGVYKVDAFRMVFAAPNPTPPVPKFDLEAFMSTRFGLWEAQDKQSVKVVLEVVNKGLVEFFTTSYWHPSQEFISNEEGTLQIILHAGISPELVSWVLHWAPDMRVLEPSHLKEEVLRRAKELVERNS